MLCGVEVKSELLSLESFVEKKKMTRDSTVLTLDGISDQQSASGVSRCFLPARFGGVGDLRWGRVGEGGGAGGRSLRGVRHGGRR